VGISQTVIQQCNFNGQAAELHVSREAYRMANLVRDGKMTKDGALRELKERCPGLTDADYEKAFHEASSRAFGKRCAPAFAWRRSKPT